VQIVLKNDRGLYAAFMAGDSRFDGRYFVGVSSTGIYCRPVCRAKKPKVENCTFYSSAAEAERAGYRPCLLCRPELAPGSSIADATANLAYRAMRMLEEKCGSGQSVDDLAGRLGYTSRHLRRVFMSEYNVTPIQYLQTCRLLLAKNLLTDTDLSVLDIAMAAGFGSLRRFNAVFKKQYNLTPSALRKRAPGDTQRGDEITLILSYRPPYPWEEMLKFFAGRAIPGVETVRNGEYMRTALLTTAKGEPVCGWVRVGHNPQKNALTVTANETLLPALAQVLARVQHMFDLHCDPHVVYETLRAMNDTRPGLFILGTRLPGCFNAFEMTVRTVLGQQITVKAASTLAGRLVRACGKPISTGIDGLTHVFPTPEDILAPDGSIEDLLGSLGVISARAKTIYALAQALARGEIDIDHCAQPEDEMKKLRAIRGIGAWSSQYIAIRAMEWPDAFLETDAGIKKALEPYTSRELLQMAEAWRPWRSYATMGIWNTL
jgi:AraC family transcriptional regulator of adaptative response / DNA-3-methyladenine glycosylase II